MTDAVLDTRAVADADELESPARRALRRLIKRKGAVVGMAVIAVFVVLALFAPLLVPFDPIATSWTLVRKAPSSQHWFGTDDLGRDIFARGRVRVPERRHSRERIAPETVGMAEIVFRRHVAAHPLRGLLQRERHLKRPQAVLRPVLIDEGQKRRLFGVQSGLRIA